MENKNEYDYVAIVARLPKHDKITLSRSFGTPLLRLSTNALVSFFKTLPKKDEDCFLNWEEELASKFFVASLYCYLHKDDEYKKGKEPFEKVLEKVYKSQTVSVSTRNKIENLLNADFTSGGGLERKLQAIINGQKDAFKNIDFNKLQKDIQYWNKKSFNSSKNKWAKTIITNGDINNEKELINNG